MSCLAEICIYFSSKNGVLYKKFCSCTLICRYFQSMNGETIRAHLNFFKRIVVSFTKFSFRYKKKSSVHGNDAQA